MVHLGEASAQGRHHDGVGGRQSWWAKVTPVHEKEKQVTISTPKPMERCFQDDIDDVSSRFFSGIKLVYCLFWDCSKLACSIDAHVADGTAQSSWPAIHFFQVLLVQLSSWDPCSSFFHTPPERPVTVVAFPVGYAFLLFCGSWTHTRWFAMRFTLISTCTR